MSIRYGPQGRIDVKSYDHRYFSNFGGGTGANCIPIDLRGAGAT